MSDYPTPVVHLSSVSKTYGQGDTQVLALDKVDVSFEAGRFTAIMGPSGSGKSTMLHVLAALDTPTSGHVVVDGTNLSRLGDDELTKLRRDRIGFVFQAFNLVPTLDAEANITLPLRLAGRAPDPAWFDEVVKALDLRPRLRHLPSQLSGGQQQRVAVARALVSRPAVIVADEPTGNLDSASSAEVLQLLRTAVDDLGQSVIMVTHDQKAALVADRVLVVRDGRIVSDLRHPSAEILAESAR
ncbi:ABC transporter ATP-binding protein [Schaalia sp. 19OD2882]|uniref:ABC transporter ATP-binding protein n=1 Tax=Schaalia sp. 19OD2882 TaxID=2794089 RepID=UPI001C1EFCF6|nr:ABC transporter ATP-binding protein [Schaalia sp. 19OD2882]QWW19548.1 ABC transporter ATP-binding protein [Schaalia sp. 19OD2882]